MAAVIRPTPAQTLALRGPPVALPTNLPTHSIARCRVPPGGRRLTGIRYTGIRYVPSLIGPYF